MDFIETLPTSSGCDAILVVVDRLTKQGIFILTTIHCTSEDLAVIFIMHVFSKHGVPKHVTSDRGPEFVSRFSAHSEKHSIWTSTTPPVTIPKVMHKRNKQTKLSNSTCRYFAIINRTTGIHFFCLQNSLITTLRMLLWEYLLFLPIKVTIWISQFIPNEI